MKSVCKSVHAPIFTIFLRIPLNVYMLYELTIACFGLKMVYEGQVVRVRRDTKEFRYVTVHWRIYFKLGFSEFIFH